MSGIEQVNRLHLKVEKIIDRLDNVTERLYNVEQSLEKMNRPRETATIDRNYKGFYEDRVAGEVSTDARDWNSVMDAVNKQGSLE